MKNGGMEEEQFKQAESTFVILVIRFAAASKADILNDARQMNNNQALMLEWQLPLAVSPSLNSLLVFLVEFPRTSPKRGL